MSSFLSALKKIFLGVMICVFLLGGGLYLLKGGSAGNPPNMTLIHHTLLLPHEGNGQVFPSLPLPSAGAAQQPAPALPSLPVIHH